MAQSAAAEEGARARAQAIERRLAPGSLNQLKRLWDPSASQAASLFAVSRQACAITAMLLDHVQVDRIPGVVRRAADMFRGARANLRCLLHHSCR